jgi:hypothetical protein
VRIVLALAAWLAAAASTTKVIVTIGLCKDRRECVRIGRHAGDRLDTRQSAPLGIHLRYEVDDVFDATIDAGDVFPVREGGTAAHLTGKHVEITRSKFERRREDVERNTKL